MRNRTRDYSFLALSGIALAISFPGWHAYPLAWLALAPVFALSAHCTPGEAAKRFFFAGWVFHSFLLQWLMSNIYWAGGWAVLGYQFLCVYLSLYWALFGLFWSYARGRWPIWSGGIASGIMWAGMEYLQATLFTGFGWSALGYSQGVNLPMAQWAAVGGVGLISAMVAGFNANLGVCLGDSSGRMRRCVGAVIAIGAMHAGGQMFVQPADYSALPLRAGIVQTNFPIEMKWDFEYSSEMIRNTIDKSRLLIQHAPVEFLVWPEALAINPLDRAAEDRALVEALARDTGCPIFTGATRFEGKEAASRNSSFLFDSTGKLTGYYDKVHLAPFGEYVPLANLFPFIGKVVPAIGDIAPGEGLQLFGLGEGKRRFGPMICFEVLFADLAEQLRQKGADFLVVITNLGWFGSSCAIPQELEIARFRAIETRLPLVHCANTGISGVFDPWGRFSMINGWFDWAGRFSELDNPSPMNGIMRRCAGALPVAAPGARVMPWPPMMFSWVAGVVSLLGMIRCLITPRWQSPAGGAAGS